MLTLRDYQKDCVDTIDNMEKGRGLVSMATGLGKTVIFSHIKRKGRVLIISHREELVRQPIKYYDCPCGIEQAAVHSSGEEVVSASVQTLSRRLDQFAPDAFDMIITDEAHHAAAPSYRKIYAHFRPRLHIGFTATPNRGDRVRLDDIFDNIIFQRDLKWGIKNGWLTDINCLRAEVGYDLRNVRRRMGDFAVRDLDRTVNNADSNAAVARVYRRLAHGQTLIFAASVEHARNIAKEIDGAVAVTEKTKDRRQIIEDFTARKIPCIVNCMVFTEGTDMPLIETIIMARPTQNPSLYTQMVGRGLRPYRGKNYLTLIDCVGITDNLDICTAPSLLGLDYSDVPARRRNRVQGMLTKMQNIVEKARECPETWMLNVRSVRLFADSQGVNVRDINWVKKSNGDLAYQFACGDRIGIKAMDELGRTRIMRYCFDDKKNDFVYTESPFLDLQTALDRAVDIFYKDYADEKNLWYIYDYFSWEYQLATQRQLKYIRSKLSNEEWNGFMARENVTKGDASQVLSALMVRDLKKSDLLRMHKKAAEKKAEAERERRAQQNLKIRMVLTGRKPPCNYYAIKHPTDLMVTDSREIAEETGAKLNLTGVRCRYRVFSSLADARQFLRE